MKDQNQPVVVKFKSFQIDIEEFPNREELIQVFNLCKQTWAGRNKKSEGFIHDALKILNQNELKMLRISDFNTKGLERAKDGELGTPWSSLVKEAGSSNKDENWRKLWNWEICTIFEFQFENAFLFFLRCHRL